MTGMTISTKGWIVIPKVFRDKYGLLPGSKVAFVDYGGILSLLPVPDDPVKDGLGVLKRFVGERSLTEALLGERAADRHREDLGSGTSLRP